MKNYIVFFGAINYVVKAKNKKQAIKIARELLKRDYWKSRRGKAYELGKEYFSQYIV